MIMIKFVETLSRNINQNLLVHINVLKIESGAAASFLFISEKNRIALLYLIETLNRPLKLPY